MTIAEIVAGEQDVSEAVTVGGFRTVCRHTDTAAPGAEAFRRAMPTVEVHGRRPDPYNCAHFVLDLPELHRGHDR